MSRLCNDTKQVPELEIIAKYQYVMVQDDREFTGFPCVGDSGGPAGVLFWYINLQQLIHFV